MKIFHATIALFFLLVLFGCTTSENIANPDPFYSFSEEDIAKVVICFETPIYGPDKSFDNPEEPYDSIFHADFYLQPSGFAIKNRKMISELYNAAKSIEYDLGYASSGILSYQVYLDKEGKVLAIVHIVNWESYINIGKGYIKDGWIHFAEFNEDSIIIAGRSPKYCRIIYDFMKKNMPEKIKELDGMYKKQGGLEKILFKQPEAHNKEKRGKKQD
jgi:hypothetical protein